MNFYDLPAFYEILDSKYNVTNNELDSATYTNVDCNFVFSAKYARHRWFNYKEGFSPILVEKTFDEYGLDKNSVVCDPFCGAGTTLAVAKVKGMKSIGFEVNPFAAFITKVKTEDYTQKDIASFKKLLSELEQIVLRNDLPLPENEYLKRIFESEMLTIQLNIRDFIRNAPESKAKSLLFFAWICTLEECSLYRKAGNGLKIKRKPPEYPQGSAFQFAYDRIFSKAQSMIEDYSEEDNGPVPKLFVESVTNLEANVEQESIDLILFSPPYANCFDYTKIYYLELWFGEFVNSTGDQKKIRMNSLRSHCHATWPDRYTNFNLPELNDQILPLLREQKLWTNRIPDMLNGYFADMEEALRQMYKTLKIGGHCSIVVSNSAYAGIIIPTDVFLAMIAEKIGFKVNEIAVERLIITSSQQYKKTEHIRKYLRESIVKLEK
ncbi:DNA methyltransferase [Ruminococcus sp.]|uniref:DNA methyltransferase n=1 Tax=Ruminococcus sp. TaxID=41978 RepID=UPI0025D6CE5F|nr:DNA methyltransferase [Ruminococcus sp.]